MIHLLKFRFLLFICLREFGMQAGRSSESVSPVPSYASSLNLLLIHNGTVELLLIWHPKQRHHS
uniref:Uncharacterized protein n=1 Tax=Setaria viridis TaxID=4556 RepID=A0A4U6T885_SETVI|nr:hypothetical protein SEVIR_9G448500v2 [Setaria viridis]